MQRIPYPDPATLPEAMRKVVEANPANVTRILAGASQPVFNGFAALSSAFTGGGSPLPPKLREIAILRVGYLSNAAYEVFQHEALARYVGLNEEQIGAIKTGGAAAVALGEAGAAVLAYTDDLVKNVRPGDETLAGVRKHLDDVNVTDLTLVIGMYMMVSRFLEATGIEIDDAPIDWKDVTKPEA
ncbi:MAG: carboxymuconolactone decarboxylase family protein [Novosphingobium sp.]|nr:carboxymuconolactone decarboxylase family protein [Novosphingobium sp.]